MIQLEDFSIGINRISLCHPTTLSALDSNCLLIDGETGCGKSSCLKAIVGFKGYWQRGQIYLGKGPQQKSKRREFGNGFIYLPQDPLNVGEISIGEFLTCYSEIQRGQSMRDLQFRFSMMRTWIKERLSTFLPEYLRPLGDLNRSVGVLNHAHARYASILRMPLSDVSVALLDEPFEGLGSTLTGLVNERLNEHLRQGLQIVIVDHRKLIERCSAAKIAQCEFRWTYGE